MASTTISTTTGTTPKDVVKKLLQSVIKGKGILEPTIHIEGGNKKGDGYLSSITKVKVTSHGNKDLNLIIKMAPDVGVSKPLLNSAFRREIFFYNTIVTDLNQFLQHRGITDNLVNVPTCLKTGNDYLVLENINSSGYSMWNRKVQMNEEHINVAIRQYAKYHAVSYTMKALNPNIYKDLTASIEPSVPGDKYISNIRKFCDRCFTKDGDRTIYYAIQKYLDSLKNYMISVGTDKSKHSVILHGDSWCNNVLFNYKDKKPTEASLLDFQLCFLGSPMIDLAYFFLVSSPKEVLDNYKHHLRIYYEELQKWYLKLGGPSKTFLSFKELLQEWKIYAKYGFTMSFFTFRSMLCEDNEALDFNDLNDLNIPIEDMFASRIMTRERDIEQLTTTLALYMYKNDLL